MWDYEESAALEGQVRIKVYFGAPKRGSEMTMYYGARGAKFPMGLGNMFVSRIIELGDDVDEFEIGDRVACHRHLRADHIRSAGQLLAMNDRMTWKEAVCHDLAQWGEPVRQRH